MNATKNKYFAQVSDRWKDDDDDITPNSRHSSESDRSRDDFRSAAAHNRKISIIEDWNGPKKNNNDLLNRNRDYVIEQWEEDDDFEIHNQSQLTNLHHHSASRAG